MCVGGEGCVGVCVWVLVPGQGTINDEMQIIILLLLCAAQPFHEYNLGNGDPLNNTILCY